MKLHTLGTGGPRPDPARTSACHVLEVGAERLMFDIGRGAIQHVAQKGFPMAGIGPLFVTHLHVDHIGELANYLITSWLAGRRKPLQVFGPPGIVFFDRSGSEVKGLRVVGFQAADRFAATLDTVLR